MSQPGCDHCWHMTGNFRLALPSADEQVCCHCGATRWHREEDHLEGHGPHHPSAVMLKIRSTAGFRVLSNSALGTEESQP